MKKSIKLLLIAGSMTVATGVQAASSGVEIDHLGVNNTLVRVTGEGKYLIVPVQEANDEAIVKVIVDGKLEQTLNIRLAKSKVDYTVPIHLDEYKGKDVVLNVVTQQGRASIRDAKTDACWENFSVTDTFDTTNTERFRPRFHHTPLFGWMNDPNGMVYKDGVWHLCYQWNPYGSKWQNLSWGQSTSTDLVHWDRSMNPVIVPDGLGMIFSGSSAIDKTNSAGFGKDAIVTMFTSADVSQIQSLASSTDGGQTYDIYPGNPVLTLDTEARDPNMFWDDKAGHWVLTLAHALDKEMLFFTSPDMKTWTLQSAFGKGEGEQSGVWECPDMFELTVDGTDQKKWVLLCNINPGGPFGGSAIQYFVGDWDGKTFTADTDASGKIPTKWLDYGKDNYALVSWSDAPDDRRTVMGWMSNWQYAAEVPTMQFRSANTLPREMGLFKADDGQIYASNAPSPEVDALRDKLTVRENSFKAGKSGRTFNLPTTNDGVCEILLNADAQKAETITMRLANKLGDEVTMIYDTRSRTISFDRRKSGITDFSQDFPAVTAAPTFETSGNIKLRIFIDRSSIELFGNDGRFVMTNLVFPNEPYSTLTVSAQGGTAKISDLKIYSLK